jgi:S-adenosylmethionine decarboxylase proenzyme
MQGIHLVGDLQGCKCNQTLMLSCAALEKLLVTECDAAGLTAVAARFHPFGTEEAPAGVTGVVLLEESHVCIHTWPELGCVTLDVYVCSFSKDNESAARTLFRQLVAAFAPEDIHTQELERGLATAVHR